MNVDYVFINGYVTVNSSRILFAYVINTIVKLLMIVGVGVSNTNG